MSKKKKAGLTAYNRRKMNAEDVSQWVEANREELVKAGLLAIQPDPNDQNREIWYLKFER